MFKIFILLALASAGLVAAAENAPMAQLYRCRGGSVTNINLAYSCPTSKHEDPWETCCFTGTDTAPFAFGKACTRVYDQHCKGDWKPCPIQYKLYSTGALEEPKLL
ncbi:hypothetical protein FA10DRAFT_261706 [Acaromyces ingoldii]|uniref:Uncharacterized protein n=1 Tax=Acaromyces ingoldii TaxID=215250 RepID=A0A316YGQ4_9BASI|nr:hypothetical protein FA10DRAFT_261706 [Acaromyces ingoldii]PWN88311.1 hypothetical protein FA10DRAFT_261706 [Acaromyces ingoldii]